MPDIATDHCKVCYGFAVVRWCIGHFFVVLICLIFVNCNCYCDINILF